ncbi:MAG: cyclic nucleotide-binding domain-containing protein [Deltaproteobacteria bacterium]|nr:cyclic nucleotide-binding domain-containing protein [Deltaproteobacteria bacterium]
MYRTRRFLRGSAIFKQGHHDETAFLIRSGRVSIVKQFAEREVHLCTLGPGALFGEMAVLGTGRRTATAMAAEECELVEAASSSTCSRSAARSGALGSRTWSSSPASRRSSASPPATPRRRSSAWSRLAS